MGMISSSGVVSLSVVVSRAFDQAQDEGLCRREQDRRAVAALLSADPDIRPVVAARLVHTVRLVADLMRADPLPIGMAGRYRDEDRFSPAESFRREPDSDRHAAVP